MTTIDTTMDDDFKLDEKVLKYEIFLNETLREDLR